MKRVLFSMVLLLAASFTFAQEKNVKEAKSIANGVNPDFAKAEELINQALTNPETKDNAETWDVAGLIQRKNEKITALYERLSRDDFGKDDDQQRESNSIVPSAP